MKKSYLMIAVAAALFAACSNTDTFKDSVKENNNQKPFAFSAFTDKSTKADDSNLLQDFYNSFAVYGWKTVDGSVVQEAVFENTPNQYFTAQDITNNVTYAGSTAKPADEWGQTPDAGWYYEDVRYWDKLADGYQFFAIAPYSSASSPEYSVTPTAPNATADVKNNNFSIYDQNTKYDISTEYNLARTVFASTTTENNAPKANLTYFGFKKDYMIATKSYVNTSDVTLNFHHILAKLNVKIQATDAYTGKQTLKVNELKIDKLDKEGYFTYKTNMTTKGWTSGDEARTIDINTAYSLVNDENDNNYNGYYWIETLIFPQIATCKSIDAQSNADGLDDPYLYIEYQIGDEVYKAWYDFAHIWNKSLTVGGTYEFLQGSQYNLTLTVGPEPIQFDANVTEWVPVDKNWDVEKNDEIVTQP